MIPLYTIEEHHEAFYIWNSATTMGILPPFGNTLLHVDHHLDFECGAYGADLLVLFESLSDMQIFTYNSLGIADFICPAIYQSIFNEVVIVQNFSSVLSEPVEKAITQDLNGSLAIKELNPFCRVLLSKPQSDYRMFTYSQGGLGDFSTPQSLVLDIDLDYFCWDDSLSGVPDKSLEITEQAYRDVTGNPYHPFRLFPKAWIRPEEKNGRFYMRYLGLPMPESLPKSEKILKRIDLFVNWLDRNKIEPCLISLCRSRHSGYTPGALWAEVERNLQKRLSEVYKYDLQS